MEKGRPEETVSPNIHPCFQLHTTERTGIIL